MASLSQIIDVTISRDTKAATQKGFGIPLVLGTHTIFAELFRQYEDTDGMLDDGFTESDDEFLAAQAIFAQEQHPEHILVGKRTAEVAQVVQIDVTTVANTTLYRATINGVNHDFTSDGSATALEIRDGLISAINGGSEPVTAAIFDADSLSVTADVAGDPFTSAVTANLTLSTTTANHNIASDIQDIIQEDGGDDWYCLITEARAKRDILYAAAEIETRKKIYAACSDDADVINNVAGNVLESLEALNYDRTFYLWSDVADDFPEAAWAGLVLPDDPGSETWKFKNLSGIVADVLTSTEQANVKNKNGNTYEEIAGTAITAEGVVVSGEFIDVIRFVDWLEARLQERIYTRLINAKKIPFTDAGVAIIESEVRAQLIEGINAGGLAADPEPTVTAPKVADVSFANRAARFLPDVEFDATLAGAIHKTEIRGRVTV